MHPARESIAVEQFGPYEVYERLGMGGMASVHRAKKRGPAGFERTVALKRMLSHLTEDRGFVESFVREAKVVSLLAHPNIAQTYDFGRINGIFYIAMELVSGFDVRKLLRHAHKTNDPIPLPVVMSILGELCEAMDYAHSFVDENGTQMNIVHRDISPSNMILAHTGHLKIIDFGIAKASTRQLHTETGTVKGKLGYMAPETALGMPTGPVSDIFSMGVVAWELVTAQPLFSARTDFETMRKLREEHVAPPSTINPTCPPMLDHLILAALHRESEQRLQSARAFRATLDSIAHQFGIQTSARAVADWIKNTLPEAELPRPSMAASAPSGSQRMLPLPAGPETQISRPRSSRASGLRRSDEDVQLATEIWGEDATHHTSDPGPDFSLASNVRSPEPLPYTPLGLSVPSLAPPSAHTVAPAAKKSNKVPVIALASLAIIAGILGGILYAKREPQVAASTQATVRFDIEPATSVVEVGGNAIGSGSPLETELAPGVYSIAVRHEGYKTWTTSVVLEKGGNQTIHVALEPDAVALAPTPDAGAPLVEPMIDAGSVAAVAEAEDDDKDKPAGDDDDDHERDAKSSSHKSGSHRRPRGGDKSSSGTSGSTTTNKVTAGSASAPDPIVTKPDPRPDPIVTKPDPKPDPVVTKPIPKPDPVDTRPKTTPVVGPSSVTKLSGEIPQLRSQSGQSGDVTAKMCIDETGRVTSVKVIKGPADIASDLQRALLTWKFRPWKNRDNKLSPVCFPQSMRVVLKP